MGNPFKAIWHYLQEHFVRDECDKFIDKYKYIAISIAEGVIKDVLKGGKVTLNEWQLIWDGTKSAIQAQNPDLYHDNWVTIICGLAIEFVRKTYKVAANAQPAPANNTPTTQNVPTSGNV